MDLSRTVSEINSDFSLKSHNFPTSVYFAPLLTGIGYPENWVSAQGVKNYNHAATGPQRKFDDIFSHVDKIHERDRQTDGRTPGNSKDRAYA